MSKPYLSRKDITLEEETLTTFAGAAVTTMWTAIAYGTLNPTKETINMRRTSRSAGEALTLLREAIEEQGWELR